MVVEVKKITQNSVPDILDMFGKTKGREKKTLAKHFGKLKRGIDGLEYQKTTRSEWN